MLRKIFSKQTDASIKIKTKSGKLSYSRTYGISYIFYDYEGIFISTSIDSILFNNDDYLYNLYYPSLYSIRVSNKYIIKSFSIMTSDSGGNNISNNGDNLNIIICYI